MNYTFPVFVLSKDDKSVRMLTDEQDVGYYERPDIKDNLYIGWDLNGNMFKINWDTKKGEPKIEVIDGCPQPDQLRDVLYQYAKTYMPDIDLTSLGRHKNIVALYKNIEQRIDSGKFRNKIKKFFKKIVK